MRWGSALLLVGATALGLVVWTDGHPALAMASYVLAGAGMGFGYPRTSVAMLDASTDRDRGFNSAALSIADSLGAALALSVSGVVFGAAERAEIDPFGGVFALAILVGLAGTFAAGRTAEVSRAAAASSP